MTVYYGYRLASIVVPRVPRPVGYWLADRLGDLSFRFNRRARAAVCDNLRHVLGNGARSLAPVARRTFRHQARNYVDLFRAPALDGPVLEALIDIDGWEHLEAARASGRGVILVSGHFGNVDLVLNLLSLRGLRITVVTEHLKPERLYQLVSALRARAGTHIVPVDQSLKPVVKALQAGQCVVLAADRTVTGTGGIYEFFGAPARLPDGYAALARRTGALILVGFCRRTRDRRFHLVGYPPFGVPKTHDRDADVRRAVARVLDIFEVTIRAHPDQWVVFERVWQEPDA